MDASPLKQPTLHLQLFAELEPASLLNEFHLGVWGLLGLFLGSCAAYVLQLAVDDGQLSAQHGAGGSSLDPRLLFSGEIIAGFGKLLPASGTPGAEHLYGENKRGKK